MTQAMEARPVAEDRVGELLADAALFFEAHLWESRSRGSARRALDEKGLDPEVLRAFGVGYAPVGHDELTSHLAGLGYSIEEVLAAGLATRSVRGRAHVHFRSRVMFPVRDRGGRVLGFAGLGLHLGPSWSLWVTSPDVGLYRRSQAVFGFDRAASEIDASGTALVRPDCVEVLIAHQDGGANAVTVHTGTVTWEQRLELAGGVRGGIDALELDLPPGMRAEAKGEEANAKATPDAGRRRPRDAAGAGDDIQPRHPRLKRIGLVTATGLAAMNAWTGAPLLAVWIGSQLTAGQLVSVRAVLAVLVTLAALEFLLLLVLTWLQVKYDELTGRPRTATQTSPWHRSKRGDRVQDIRGRYGVSAPEKVVAACVIVGVLAFEVWFFFFAGSSLLSS